jgi:hypothetical protein
MLTQFVVQSENFTFLYCYLIDVQRVNFHELTEESY